MNASERKIEILKLLKEGSMTLDELAKKFNVSVMTIRRDLRKFENQDVILISQGTVYLNKSVGSEESYILKKDKIETYIPREETLMERNGIKKKLRRPVINSLMFFRSTVCRALEVQRQFTNKVILYTRQKGLKRLPLAIPDREMNIFMLVTSSGEQGMEYFGEDNSKFQQGERVRVIDGKFKGAEGVICRIRKNRRLVVTVQGVCAVATSYIPQAFLQRIGQD